MSWQRRSWSDWTDSQADLGFRFPHVPGDMFRMARFPHVPRDMFRMARFPHVPGDMFRLARFPHVPEDMFRLARFLHVPEDMFRLARPIINEQNDRRWCFQGILAVWSESSLGANVRRYVYRRIYRIRPNFRTYPYKRTVDKFSSLRVTASVFCLLLYKGICCGYPFELHRLVDAIQMSIHNICFYKKKSGKIS